MHHEINYWRYYFSRGFYSYSALGYRSIAGPLLSLSPRLFKYRIGVVAEWFDSAPSSSSKPQHHEN